MTNDALLDILKWALLALLYLFFARVLWAVWSELRTPRPAADRGAGVITALPDDPTMGAIVAPVAATATQDRPAPVGATIYPAPRRRGGKGVVTALVVLEPRAARGRAYPVDREVTVGRAATCTVSMPDDAFVSTLHAHVVVEEGQVWVEDLGSTNGSYLNGERLTTRRLLRTGDRLQFGQTLLEAQ